MKIILPVLTCLFFHYCSAQQFQLAPPMVMYNSIFFAGSSTVVMEFAQHDTKIFYTTNDSDPDKEDIVYEKPIVIKKSFTTLKAKVFGKDFLPSETVQVTFIKDGLKIKSVQQSLANEKFPGNGPATLFDDMGGIADLHNKNFLGYQQDSIEIDVALDKRQPIHSLLLDFLQDQGSWIFLPQKIQVLYFDNKKDAYQNFGIKKFASDTIVNQSSTIYEVINADKKIVADKLKIIIEPLQSIPEGHPGKGTPAWLFIDEIKVY